MVVGVEAEVQQGLWPLFQLLSQIVPWLKPGSHFCCPGIFPYVSEMLITVFSSMSSTRPVCEVLLKDCESRGCLALALESACAPWPSPASSVPSCSHCVK